MITFLYIIIIPSLLARQYRVLKIAVPPGESQDFSAFSLSRLVPVRDLIYNDLI